VHLELFMLMWGHAKDCYVSRGALVGSGFTDAVVSDPCLSKGETSPSELLTRMPRRTPLDAGRNRSFRRPTTNVTGGLVAHSHISCSDWISIWGEAHPHSPNSHSMRCRCLVPGSPHADHGTRFLMLPLSIAVRIYAGGGTGFVFSELLGYRVQREDIDRPGVRRLSEEG
jgi:hypothetical protein